MNTTLFSRNSLVLVAALALAVPIFGQDTTNVGQNEKRKIDGAITKKDADSFVVQTSGGAYLVKMAGNTEIREKKSNPFRGARKYEVTTLVRGLEVEVEGVGDGTALVANKIRFTQNDLKTAETVESRVTPVEGRLGTAESRVGSAENRLSASEENAKKMSGQISELDAISNAAKGGAKAAQEAADSAMAGVSTTNERITSLDDYDTVHTASIRFKAGSAVLSDEAKKTLNDVAEQAKQRKGFVIEIAGFASAEGSKDFNMRLSNERAHAAAQYLAVEHDIPLRRIITPLGYGVTHAVADNKTRDGRKENRRTEVKILVSKGLMTTPSSQKPTSGGGN